MTRPILTLAGEVTLTTHAIERYIEFVKPAYTFKHAHWELTVLLPQAEWAEECPAWLGENPARERDGYLVLCDSLAFMVVNATVVTVLPRGNLGPVTRAVRSQQRGHRRRARRAKEHNQVSTGYRRTQKNAGKPKRSGFGLEDVA